MSADILAIFRRFRSLDPIERLEAKRELFAWLDGKDAQARDGLRRPLPIAEVKAYADQFAEFASQVAGMGLDDEDVLTIGYASDGTLIGSAEGKETVYVPKDVSPPLHGERA